MIRENEEVFKEKYSHIINEWASDKYEEREDLNERLTISAENAVSVLEGIPNSTLVTLIVGIGDGSLIRLLKAELLPSAQIIIWEPDLATLYHVASVYPIADLLKSENIVLVAGDKEETATSLEKVINERVSDINMYHAMLVIMAGFYDVYTTQAELLGKMFHDSVRSNACNVATILERSSKQCDNLLYALSVLPSCPVADQLLESIPTRDIPVILVSAGPSLEKNVEELRNVQGKALVVTVAHAAKTLHQRGIKSDFVAVIDYMEGQHFLDYDESLKERLLISMGAATDIQKKYAGKQVYLGEDLSLFPVSRVKMQNYDYIKGGSVATSVFGFFMKGGFKTVILVGQDLAYGDDGHSHAGGSSAEDINSESETEVKLQGIDGREVRSRTDWEMFLRSFEDTIRKTPQALVIDATEGGARIEGTKIMTLKEAIQGYCNKDYPINEWIGELNGGGESEQNEILEIMKDHYRSCELVGEEIEEELALNKKIAGYIANGSFTDGDHKMEYDRYDHLYRQIVTPEQEYLLFEYSDSVLQSYVKNALTIERIEDLQDKLDMEYNLFVALQSRNVQLKERIISLFPDVLT